MGRSTQYRLFAARCLEIAQNTGDLHTKAVMLQMAQVWSRLADETESRRDMSEARNNDPNDSNQSGKC